MPHRTTRTNHGKIYSLLLKLKGGPPALARRLFARADTDARRYGWQVTPTWGGLGRRYRDPRFDALTACADCHGCGTRALGNPCRTCGGTGRIVAEPTAGPPSSRRGG